TQSTTHSARYGSLRPVWRGGSRVWHSCHSPARVAGNLSTNPLCGGAHRPCDDRADRTWFENPLLADFDNTLAKESLEVGYPAEWIGSHCFADRGHPAKVEPRCPDAFRPGDEIPERRIGQRHIP